MATNVVIRPFAASDLEVIQRVREAAFEPVFRSLREIVGPEVSELAFERPVAEADAMQAEWLECICDPKSIDQVYVALIENEVVGFVSFYLNIGTRIGQIGLHAVHPDHASRGVGTTLCNFAIEQMRRSGMLLARVDVGGDPSHIPARRAYEKAGFGPSLPRIEMYRML